MQQFSDCMTGVVSVPLQHFGRYHLRRLAEEALDSLGRVLKILQTNRTSEDYDVSFGVPLFSLFILLYPPLNFSSLR